MKKELIPISKSTIAGMEQQTVNARELHKFLNVGKQFSHWIQKRIRKYGFQENHDFVVIAQTGYNPMDVESSNDVPSQGGRPGIEYHLTLDMAKEVCMVERNEYGRQARKYFIDCERRLLCGIPHSEFGVTRGLTLARILQWAGLEIADLKKYVMIRLAGCTQKDMAKVFGLKDWQIQDVEDALKAAGYSFPDRNWRELEEMADRAATEFFRAPFPEIPRPRRRPVKKIEASKDNQ